MPPDVRRHWRDPRYWEWWWREVVRGEAKFALAAVGALAALVVGFFGARGLNPGDDQAAFTTNRVVTIVRTLHAKGPTNGGRPLEPPRVVTTLETVTEPRRTDVVTVPGRDRTDVVTVRGRDRTVVVRRPGERVVVTKPGKTTTKAVTVRGRDRVVTNTRIATVVQTATTDRAVTVTGPGATHTVTREVTGPTVTRTQSETVTQTVTQPVTVTEEVTVTDLTIVTVTLPP